MTALLSAVLLVAQAVEHPAVYEQHREGDLLTLNVVGTYFDADDAKDVVEQLEKAGELHEGSRVHMVDRASGELLFFYREGLVHQRTDRRLQELQKLYLAGELEMERLKGQRILDLGCGDGRFVKELRFWDVEADGIDLFLEQGEVPRSFLVQGDITSMPFPDDTFDLLFSAWVLIKEDRYDAVFVREALKEVARVAKPGALLYITPVDVPRAELESLLAPFEQIRIKDISRVSDEEEAVSRLVLEIRK